FFHLEFVAWWALVFVAAAASRAVRARIKRQPLARPIRARAIGAGITMVAIAGLPLAPLSILRVYQQYHVPGLFESYARLSRTPLALSRHVSGDQTVITPDDLWAGRRPGDQLTVNYLAVEFSSEHCGAADLPLTLRYE